MLTIPRQYPSLVYIRPISWEEVFAQWKNLEAYQESWEKHWQERGFDSWDEWRLAYIQPFHPETLSWNLYQIGNPQQDCPLFFGAPTKAWINAVYEGKTTEQIKDIAHRPVVTENEKILSIREKFPQETMLAGVVCDEKIVLVEGMHRASALTLWNLEIPFTAIVTIALAEWTEPLPIIGGNSKNIA